jgi:hypothetical protein
MTFDEWFIEFSKTDLSQYNHRENCEKAWEASKEAQFDEICEGMVRLRMEAQGNV